MNLGEYEYLVRLDNVSHCFESILYEGVNLEVRSGDSIAILGVSGSGKSTILNHISTLLRPERGSVLIGGYGDVYELNWRELTEIRRSFIGVVFQSHYLFRGFSALENLEVSSIISGNDIDDGVLRDFGISHTMGQQIGELSGGQQQRLSIARVLMKRPKVILADEPTGNLDSETAESVMSSLLKYVESTGSALIVATHDTGISRMCKSVYSLKNKSLTLTYSSAC